MVRLGLRLWENRRRRSWRADAWTVFWIVTMMALPVAALADPVVETFESFAEDTIVTTQIPGLTISGRATVAVASRPVVPGEPKGLASIGFSSILLITFESSVSTVGAIIDLGQVRDGVRLTAFDGPDGTGEILGEDTTVTESFISVSASGIRSAQFEALGATYLIDNLTYEFDEPPVVIEIDIKPGSDANPINLSSRGVIPVAILGADGFDVESVDVATLRFGPDGAQPAHHQGGHSEDINGDGFQDLVSHYRTQEAGIAAGSEEACLSGETQDGTPFEACDQIQIVPPPKPASLRVDWSASVSLPAHGTGTLSGTLGVFEVEQAGDFFLLPGDGSLTVEGAGFDDPSFNGVRPFIEAVGAPALRFDSLDPPSATFLSTSDPPEFLTGLQTTVFLCGLGDIRLEVCRFGLGGGAGFNPAVLINPFGSLAVSPVEFEFTEQAALDVRPGQVQNTINLFRNERIPVAILGSDTLDVGDIVHSTLAFGPAGAPPEGHASQMEDVNRDGLPDLLSYYSIADTGIRLGAEQACAKGETTDGRFFEACDEIRTVRACGIGFELVLLVPVLARLRRRRP